MSSTNLKKRMTMNQLAQELNISRTTLYNIMHGKGAFSAETKERVFQALEERNFRMNKNARNLAKNQEYKIAFVGFYSTRFGYFFDEIEAGIDRAVQDFEDDGLQIVRAYSDREKPEKQIEDLKRLEEIGIENFIIFSYHYENIYPYIKDMLTRGKKVILFSRRIPNIKATCTVGCNDYLSGKLMGELLEKLSPAQSRVQLLISEHNHQDKLVVGERLEGFKEALKSVKKELEILDYAWISPVPEDERNEIRTILKERKPDVIVDFVCNLGCVAEYLKESGNEKTIVLGYDVYPEIVPYIKDSTIDAVIYQDLASQSYKAIELMFDYMCYGVRPKRENYYLSLNVVFATNCEYFEAELSRKNT